MTIHDSARADGIEVEMMQVGNVCKVAAWIPMSTEILRGEPTGFTVGEVMRELVDRAVNPWRYPDTHRWPSVDLFPRLSRLARWVRRAA